MFIESKSPLPAPTPSPATSQAPSLGDVIDMIRSSPDLSVTEKRDQAAAVSTALRICTQPQPGYDTNRVVPAISPVLSCAYLNTRLFRCPPATYGLKRTSFDNMLSQLRRVMRRLGLHAPKCPKAAGLPFAWHALHDAVSLHRQLALQGFMTFCATHSIGPEAVTSDVLGAFENWLLQRTLCDDASKKARGVASNWSWASKNIPDWPQVLLERPGMRKQYVLPLTAFPAELQADAERFLSALACTLLDDIFPDDADTAQSRARRRKPLRPRTVATRQFQLRQALTALVLMGEDTTCITSLRQLVEPVEQARKIIKFYLARGENLRTSQTGGIAEVIRQIARYHCKVDTAAMEQITAWTRRAAPDQQTTMSEKNTLRLQILLQPHNKANLLHLPQRLMLQASDPNRRPRDAALLAMHAAALEVLLAFPMRRTNLAELRLDQELLYLGSKKDEVTHIRLMASQTKNSQPMLWGIGAHTSKLLKAYIRDYRPKLTEGVSPYLFPNTTGGGRAPHDLAVGLSRLIEREIGCKFNVHIARHFAVARFLEHHPGQYEIARRVLGHKNVKTTVDYYAGLEINAAARFLDASLTLDRSATHLMASAGGRGQRKPEASRPPKTRA